MFVLFHGRGMGMGHLESITRVRSFVRGTCLAARSHACFGGRFRRNFLTFQEVTFLIFRLPPDLLLSQETCLYFCSIFYFILETVVIFLMYRLQDTIGQAAVFYIIHTIYAISDMFFMVGMPGFILYKSYTTNPELWSNFSSR